MKSTELPDEYFSFHEDFLLPSPTNIFIFQILWNLLKEIPGDKLLDAGCGSGTVMGLIGKKKKFHLLNGMDLSEYAVNIANTNFSKQKIDAKAFVSDISNFLCKEKYDIIISTEVIEHVDNPNEIIKNINRCLKKNGYLLLTTPLEDGRDNTKWDKSFHHLRRYNFEDLSKLLESNGFEIQSIRGIGFPFFYLFVKLKYFIHRKDNIIKPVLTEKKRKILYPLVPILNFVFYMDFILSKSSFFMERGNTIYLKAQKKNNN